MRHLLVRCFPAIFLLFISGALAWSQKQNNHWFHGYHCHIDFNGPAPVFTWRAPFPGEGNSTVSRRSDGSLLFSTNGVYIWNRNFVAMPNGSGILGGGAGGANNPTSMQGALIVPFPNDTNKYYAFSLQGSDPPAYTAGNLRYSVVDMTLDGGLGDVVPGQKNILVGSGYGEGMTAVKSDHCTVYVIVHDRNLRTLYSFEVGPSGVSTVPVVSSFPSLNVQYSFTSNYFNFVQLRASPDHNKVAVVEDKCMALYSVNRSTGALFNEMLLDTGNTGPNYIAGSRPCFSPDNKLLYFINGSGGQPGGMPSGIYQYQIDLPTIAAIKATRYAVITGPPPFQRYDIQRAKGKLYISRPYGMDAINSPNSPGAACNYQDSALMHMSTLVGGLSFQNLVIFPGPDTSYSSQDMQLCGGSLTLQPSGSTGTFLWDDGSSGSTRTVSAGGTYWVRVTAPCEVRVDTFKVIAANGPTAFSLGADTVLCAPSLTLTGPTGGASYLWSSGQTTQSITITQSGTYVLTVTTPCGLLRDTIDVTISNIAVPAPVARDTTVCAGVAFTLSAQGSGLQWFTTATGGTGSAIPPAVPTATPGTHTYYVSSGGAAGCQSPRVPVTVTVRIGVLPYKDDRTLCAAKPDYIGMRDRIDATSYLWNTGDRSCCIIPTEPGLYTTEVMGTCGIVIDSIRVSFIDCECPILPNVFTPNGDGRNDVFDLRATCPLGSFDLRIYNRWGQEVYHTQNPMAYWNGTFKGHPVDKGAYIYILRYARPGRELETRQGTVTVL